MGRDVFGTRMGMPLKIVLITSTVVASGCPIAAIAQNARAAPPAIEEIVVTARRRAEDITRVPIAITAFTAEQLQERSIETVVDLVKVTPGLNIGQTATGSPGITIRGQTRGLSGPGTPGVQTYFNDQPLDVLNGLIPTYDMDNIQVLKGPQGTLFGRNTIGGAILTYSKKPTYDVGGYAQVEYGNYNQVRVEGAINLPIIPDILALRVAGEYTDNDGYTKTYSYTTATFGPNLLVTSTPTLRPTARNFDAMTSKAFRISLRFEPTPWLHNTTVFGYRKTKGLNNATFAGLYPNGFNGSSPALYYLPPSVLANLPLGGLQGAVAYNFGQMFSCAVSTFEKPCNIRQWAAQFAPNGRHIAYSDAPLDDSYTRALNLNNTTTIDLADNLTLKNIFGWQQTISSQAVDLDGTPFIVTESFGQSKLDTYTNELQLQGLLLDDKLNFTVGGFYLKTVPKDPAGFTVTGVTAFGGLSKTLLESFFSSRSEALFAQADYDFSSLLDGLSVTAGYRYTWDHASGCAVSINFLPFAGGPPPAARVPYLPTKAQCESNAVALPATAGATSVSTHNFSVPSKKGTFTLALNWQITQDHLVYATTRRGYRSGGFNTPFFSGPNNLNIDVSELQEFDPETLNDIEIGTKNRFYLGSVPITFEAAAYRILTQGTQQFLTTSNAAPLPQSGIIQNYADLKFTGFEAAATIRPVAGLTLGGNVAHIDPKVRNLKVPPALTAVFAAYGRPAQGYIFNGITKWQYNLFASYTVPAKVLGGDLMINADYHRQAKAGYGDIVIPGYDTVDARISLNNAGGSPIDVSFYVRNLFDKYYFGGVQSSSLTGTGLASYYVAPPRTYGITLRYRFGED